MNILISAFECNPYKGSDCYVGWSYVYHLAQIHEIYVVTRAENKKDIETYVSENNDNLLKKIHFIYVAQSPFFTKVLYKVNRYLGFLGSYYWWNKKAYHYIKKKYGYFFDICHLVSIADFRFLGYFWRITDKFIVGPVGGAQETPACLSDYVKSNKKSELIRTLINFTCSHSIGYKKALRKAHKIFISNEETKKYITQLTSKVTQDKMEILSELCIDPNYVGERVNLEHPNHTEIHIVVSGRLIYRKGVELLLDVVSKIDTSTPYVIDIYGDGEQMQFLETKSAKLGLEDKVIFHGKIGFDEMQRIYREADIYVLPSLRETTGTAVVEAMANKLPVVALNQNGVKGLVRDDAGILVPIGQTKEETIYSFAEALSKLISDYQMRREMGDIAFERICSEYTWDKRAMYMLNNAYLK